MHKYEKIDIKVNEPFIQKFAQKYLEQRSQTQFDYNKLDEQIYNNLGFSTDV